MLIKNGLLVTENGEFKGDLLIEGGKVAKIGQTLDVASDEIIDASGKYVLPGGVDVHTHFDLDVGFARASDDFYTGTVAAACGGTTAIVDHMAFGPTGCTLGSRVEEYHRLADGKAVIDYGFHGVIQHVDDNVLTDMETLISEGITSYKLYMTYDFKLRDREVLKIMARAKELGLIVTAHTENDGVINYFRELFKAQGKLSPYYHALSRPPQCEAEAVNRLLLLSEMLGGVPLYIVHLSTEAGLEYVRQARERGLQNVFAETCPQFLLLNEELYKERDGLKYVCSPPLRTENNISALWDGVIDSSIQTIATDHCPFFYEKEKQLGASDFTKCPNGMPGVEMRIPLLFSEGVMKKRISASRFAEICATNPAKLFGLYPQKGALREGADADIIIINPNERRVISKAVLHENVDYTPYEGITLEAVVDCTISRGEIIVKNNCFLGEKGRGRYIKRDKPLV